MSSIISRQYAIIVVVLCVSLCMDVDGVKVGLVGKGGFSLLNGNF